MKWSVLIAAILVMASMELPGQNMADKPPVPLFIQVDHLGNLYELESSHTLKKYNPEGEFLSQYSHPDYLDLNQVDVKDPYKITLFYPDQQKIVILDKELNYLSELDLGRLNERYIQLCCRTVDGLFCLFDQNQQQILLIDDDVQLRSESFPLYQEGLDDFRPLGLHASHERIVLTGAEGVVVLFDHLGNYDRKLDLENYESIQLIKDRLLIFRSGGVRIYNFSSFDESTLFEGHIGDLEAFKLDPNRSELQIIDRVAPFGLIKSIKIP